MYGDSCSHYRNELLIGKESLFLSSHRDYEKNANEVETDLGIYLDSNWKSRLEPVAFDMPMLNLPKSVAKPANILTQWGWKRPAIHGIYLPWADRGVPSPDKVDLLLQWIDKLLDDGLRLEIACFGGHGRTGTLAAFIMLRRNPEYSAKYVIDYIRENYCKEAIESYEQEKRIYQLAGEEPPPMPAKVFTPSKTATPAQTYKPATKATTVAKASIAEIKNWLTRNPEERLALPWFRKEVEPTKQEVQTFLDKLEELESIYD